VRGRRRIAFAVLATAIVLVALLTPEDTGGRTGDPRLSSRSTQPQGASALYELAKRLRWRPTERLTDTIPLGDTASVHLVLDPPIAPSATETHEILDRVRRGAGLVFVLGSLITLWPDAREERRLATRYARQGEPADGTATT